MDSLIQIETPSSIILEQKTNIIENMKLNSHGSSEKEVIILQILNNEISLFKEENDT